MVNRKPMLVRVEKNFFRASIRADSYSGCQGGLQRAHHVIKRHNLIATNYLNRASPRPRDRSVSCAPTQREPNRPATGFTICTKSCKDQNFCHRRRFYAMSCVQTIGRVSERMPIAHG
jgi:hypothetical protein